MQTQSSSRAAATVPATGPSHGLTSANAGTTPQTQFLTFLLGGDAFAIGILAIKEIIEYGTLTTVPMMPICIRGVINLRGTVVPVLDLAARFGRRPTEVTRRTCIVIVEVDCAGERQDIGVIVDAVSAVLEIASDDIEPPPAFGAKVQSDFISGMGKIDGSFVIILDANRVLSVDELASLDAVTH